MGSIRMGCGVLQNARELDLGAQILYWTFGLIFVELWHLLDLHGELEVVTGQARLNCRTH